jgi:hypothetical protein
MLFGTAYEFETPVPLITPEGAKLPPTGYGTLSDRTAWSGISPARAMRVPGIGLHYLFASLDADKKYFQNLQALPKGIPEESSGCSLSTTKQTTTLSTRK